MKRFAALAIGTSTAPRIDCWFLLKVPLLKLEKLLSDISLFHPSWASTVVDTSPAGRVSAVPLTVRSARLVVDRIDVSPTPIVISFVRSAVNGSTPSGIGMLPKLVWRSMKL